MYKSSAELKSSNRINRILLLLLQVSPHNRGAKTITKKTLVRFFLNTNYCESPCYFFFFFFLHFLQLHVNRHTDNNNVQTIRQKLDKELIYNNIRQGLYSRGLQTTLKTLSTRKDCGYNLVLQPRLFWFLLNWVFGLKKLNRNHNDFKANPQNQPT